MKILAAVACVVISSICVEAVTPPTFPAQFEADVTTVNDGRTSTGSWYWSVSLKADRFDLEDDQGKLIEISDYSAGARYEIVTPHGGSARCTVQQIGNDMPSFDFSQYTFGGQRTWHRHFVDVWYHESPGSRQEYLVDANTTDPVQIGVQARGQYEGVYFDAYRPGPQSPSVFNVSSVFNGTCSKGAAADERTLVEAITKPQAGGDPAAVAAFADQHWNCADVGCTSRVQAGDAQPAYECAEFVSRALIHGGYIPGLHENDPQSALEYYKAHGKTYDLLWVSSRQGGPLGLQDYLLSVGWHDVGGVDAAVVAFVVGSDGPYSHVAVGVGKNLLDAHNMARYHVASSFYQIDQLLGA